MKKSRWILGLAVSGTMLVAGTSSQAGSDDPPLTAEQQAKLKRFQAKFVAGVDAEDRYGWNKIEEFCGAKIPMELHPTTVAYDTKKEDRSDVVMTCNGFAGSVAYMCGWQKDADPVVKEIVRTSVKRLVCKATEKPEDVDQYKRQKFTLENGTLTYTYLASQGSSNITDEGKSFLKKNARGPNGLSIGGQLIKRESLDNLSMAQSNVRKLLKEECGIALTSVTVDDKLAEHYSLHTGHSPTSACDAGLHVIYTSCRQTQDAENVSMAIKDAAKKYLKGVACVYSDTESIAIRPNGILELGHSLDAPRPRWEGRQMMGIENYYFNWLKANAGQFASGGTPSTASPSPSPASPPPRARKPGKGRR